MEEVRSQLFLQFLSLFFLQFLLIKILSDIQHEAVPHTFILEGSIPYHSIPPLCINNPVSPLCINSSISLLGINILFR